MLEAAGPFYSALFTPEPIDDGRLFRTLDYLPVNSLTPEDPHWLHENITKEDVLEIMRCTPINEAQGSDGLPYDFYQTFRHTKLAEIVCQQFNNALHHATVPSSWKETRAV